jgi:uncharacterized membrane protein YfcA
MELDLITLLILAMVGLIAGTVDSIAGGGGLITIPALLATGMPPASALATNKLQSSFGSFAAVSYFYKKGLLNLKKMKLAIICTFMGSAIGTIGVQYIDGSILNRLLPLLLATFAVYFLLSPKLQDTDSHQRISLITFSIIFGSLIGFYDGFFGPGTGSFFAIAFVSLLGFGMAKATAHTKLLNFTSNIASLLFFTMGGHVLWTIGLTMAIGQFIGGMIGSRLVMLKGVKLVRPLLVGISLIMSIRLVYQNHPEWFSGLIG